MHDQNYILTIWFCPRFWKNNEMDINSWLPLQRKSCLAGPMWTVGLTITCLQEMVYQALYFCRACEIFRCWFEEAETSLGASFLWDFFSLLQINYIWLREPGHCEVSTDTISENCLICRGERFLLLHETPLGKQHAGNFSHSIHSLSRAQKDSCSIQSMECLPFSQVLLSRFPVASPISILVFFLTVAP